MATVYKKGTGDFNAANGWNSLANGTGTDYTASDEGGGVYIVDNAANTLDLNSLAVTLNVDVHAALIQSGNTGGYLTVSGTRVVTANVTYSATSLSGMVRVGTGTGLTINGQVSCTNAGYAVVTSGSGVLAVDNEGGTACTCSGSTGRAVSHGATGTLTITGAVSATSTGSTGVSVSANATVSITGVVTSSGSGTGVVSTAGTTTIDGAVTSSATGVGVSSTTAGTVTINGDVSSTGGGYGVRPLGSGNITVNGNMSSVCVNSAGTIVGCAAGGVGILTWTGARTLAEDTDCYIVALGGTLNLATAATALSLAVSGRLSISITSGTTVNTTAAGGTSEITLESAVAQAAIMGGEYDIITPFGGGLVVVGNQIPVPYPGLIPTPY